LIAAVDDLCLNFARSASYLLLQAATHLSISERRRCIKWKKYQ